MTRVADIMNRELFHFRPGDSLATAPRFLLALGITAAPVLDEDGVPLGVLSLRDCVLDVAADATVGERMTRPAVTVSAGTTVEAAARILGETQLRRLIAVDENGEAVGVISAVDIIRALVGLAPRRPFPTVDVATGLTWTDDTLLESDRIEVAPEGPGVFLLVDWTRGAPRVLWGEWTHDIRTRLLDLLSLPQDEAVLSRILAADRVWFRAAPLADTPARRRILEAVITHHVAGEAFVSR
jgi:CBS domain-containing protein